jgi:hypothetical protein
MQDHQGERAGQEFQSNVDDIVVKKGITVTARCVTRDVVDMKKKKKILNNMN